MKLTLPIGNTVDAHRVFKDIDALLRSDDSSAVIRFSIDGSNPISRSEAEAWVEESHREGFTLVRYIIEPHNAGEVLVDLVAIAPLNDSSGADAV